MFTGSCGGVGSQAYQCAGAAELSEQHGVCQCGHALQRHGLATRRCATINELFQMDDHPSVSSLNSVCTHCGETYEQHDPAPRLSSRAAMFRVPGPPPSSCLSHPIVPPHRAIQPTPAPPPLSPQPSQLHASSQSAVGLRTTAPFYPPGPSTTFRPLGVASTARAAVALLYVLGKRKRSQGRVSQFLDGMCPSMRYEVTVVIDCQALGGDCSEAPLGKVQLRPIHPPTLTKMAPFLYRAKQEHLAFDYVAEGHPDDPVYPTLSVELTQFFDENELSMPHNKHVDEMIHLKLQSRASDLESPPRLFNILICLKKGKLGRGNSRILQIGSGDLSTELLTYQAMDAISKKYYEERQILIFIGMSSI
ncbi:hypothetical protein EDB84DRAFT_1442649 [Lactarius hengduanensis]|nr:hypothetical protein EDB84DRAFT_1442649 [Lactarius hengduanensis]